MKVDPQAAGVGQLVLARPDGGEFSLDVGRQVVARVVSADPAQGTAQINLAGQNVTVQTNLPVNRGDVLQLQVTQNAGDSLALTVTQAKTAAGAPIAMAPTLPSTGSAASLQQALPLVSRALSEFAPAAIHELARSGVAVTPDAVHVLTKAIEQSVNNGASAQSAARSFAALAGRGLELDPAVASRVSAAIDTAGSFGKELNSLAARDPAVAQALGGKLATAETLRAIVSPNLTTMEQGLARIANAVASAQGAATGTATLATAATPASSTPTVAANIVASNVATTSALDGIAEQSGGTVQQARAAQGTPVVGQSGTLAPAAQAAASAAAKNATVDGTLAQASRQGVPPPVIPTHIADLPSRAPAPSDPQLLQNQQSVRANSGSQGAGAAATAAGNTTPQPLAAAVTTVAINMTRFAVALAPSEGVMGQTAAQLARPAPTQAAAIAGTFVPTTAGGTGAGDTAKLIATVRGALLDSLGAHGDKAPQVAQLLTAATAGSQSAARALTELISQAPNNAGLVAAGKLMQALPALIASGLAPAQAAELRELARGLLAQAGADGPAASATDALALQSALERAAASGATADVREDATRLLHAMDGQQILSHPKTGMDPGYVFFQLPLPGNHSAEVLVRREPGRREVTFEQFDIAFLLDTESLGSLMIHLDAQPTAIRASIKTDRPDLLPLLEHHAGELATPLEREAGRPVFVHVDSFGEVGPPTTLLEPALGLIPGENAFYA